MDLKPKMRPRPGQSAGSGEVLPATTAGASHWPAVLPLLFTTSTNDPSRLTRACRNCCSTSTAAVWPCSLAA